MRGAKENKISFDGFCELVQTSLTEALPGEWSDAVIRPIQIEKVQGKSYRGVVISHGEQHTGISINLELFYHNMQDKMNEKEILQEIADVVTEARPPVSFIEKLSRYETAKPFLAVQLIGRRQNQKILKQIPHQNLEDMALVYRFDDMTEDGNSSVLITDQMLEGYGITKEQLHTDAMKWAPLHHPAVIENLGKVLNRMGGDFMENEIPLYLASNNENMYGASVISYPGVLDQAAKRIGGSYFLLPSSIHEMLLLRDDGVIQVDDLKRLVTEINARDVSPEECLADNVYRYDQREQVLENADTFEERKRGLTEEEEMQVEEDVEKIDKDKDIFVRSRKNKFQNQNIETAERIRRLQGQPTGDRNHHIEKNEEYQME